MTIRRVGHPFFFCARLFEKGQAPKPERPFGCTSNPDVYFLTKHSWSPGESPIAILSRALVRAARCRDRGPVDYDFGSSDHRDETPADDC